MEATAAAGTESGQVAEMTQKWIAEQKEKTSPQSEKPTGEVFFFEVCSMLSYNCRLHAASRVKIRTLQSLLYVADVCFLQFGALCRIDIVRKLGVDGGHLRSVV